MDRPTVVRPAPSPLPIHGQGYALKPLIHPKGIIHIGINDLRYRYGEGSHTREAGDRANRIIANLTGLRCLPGKPVTWRAMSSLGVPSLWPIVHRPVPETTMTTCRSVTAWKGCSACHLPSMRRTTQPFVDSPTTSTQRSCERRGHHPLILIQPASPPSMAGSRHQKGPFIEHIRPLYNKILLKTAIFPKDSLTFAKKKVTKSLK